MDADATVLLSGLDDFQTQLQLFKTCTLHKMTHLFATDVLCSTYKLPDHWHLWNSDMMKATTALQDKFLVGLTNRSSIPLHAHLISSISTNKGGLGLPHPRCVAIPYLIMSMKRCINYSTQGVWVGNTTKPVHLPSSITSLFANHQSSTNQQLQIFHKYAPELAAISVHETVENRMTHFLHKSSPNTCKDRIKNEAANRITTFLLHNTKDFLTKTKLLEILQPRTSKSLIEMCRAEPSHRQKNENFHINLKRKLRLELWPDDDVVTCACGQRMDRFGDHAFCYSHVKKNTEQ